MIPPSPSFLPYLKSRWRLAAAAGARDPGDPAGHRPPPSRLRVRRGARCCPRSGRRRRGRGSAPPPRGQLAAPGRSPRLCGRAPRAEKPPPPPPAAAPGLCVRAPGAGSWALGAARPGAERAARGARGAGPEPGAAAGAAAAMSGSSGGAAAPAASSGTAAAASAAGSGCGGGAGEGAEEAAKDLADIAAFFRSGECNCCAARALGQPRRGGAVRGPRRPRCSPRHGARRALARATAPRAGAGALPRRVPLPAASRAAARPGRRLPSPAPAPRSGVKSPRLPPPAPTAPRVRAPALCLFRGRAEEAAAGTARAEALAPEAERTGAAGPGPGERAVIWAGLGGRFVPGPSSTQISSQVSSLGPRACHLPCLGLHFCETGQSWHRLPREGGGGRDQVRRAGPGGGCTIVSRGGPGGTSGNVVASGARGAGRLRGTAWVAWRWRQCQVARCLSGEERVAAGEASFATGPRGGGAGV